MDFERSEAKRSLAGRGGRSCTKAILNPLLFSNANSNSKFAKEFWKCASGLFPIPCRPLVMRSSEAGQSRRNRDDFCPIGFGYFLDRQMRYLP